MSIVILYSSPNGETQSFKLTKFTLVGRSGTCDIQVEDPKMSGRHGSFEIGAEGEVIYRDQGSTNGSLLNKEKVNTSIITLSDEIMLGSTVFSIDENRLNEKELDCIMKSAANKLVKNFKSLLKNQKSSSDITSVSKSKTKTNTPTQKPHSLQDTRDISKKDLTSTKLELDYDEITKIKKK
jgi:pSer/pThr/pTyr-binding forkhead associated (FHA) protein